MMFVVYGEVAGLAGDIAVVAVTMCAVLSVAMALELIIIVTIIIISGSPLVSHSRIST